MRPAAGGGGGGGGDGDDGGYQHEQAHALHPALRAASELLYFIHHVSISRQDVMPCTHTLPGSHALIIMPNALPFSPIGTFTFLCFVALLPVPSSTGQLLTAVLTAAE